MTVTVPANAWTARKAAPNNKVRRNCAGLTIDRFIRGRLEFALPRQSAEAWSEFLEIAGMGASFKK